MSETALKIRIFPDPVLRKKTSSVKQVNQTHRDNLGLMAKSMYANSGIGLASPQVGLDESMIVVDIGSGLYKLINPKIVKKEGRQALEEGCLSVPGICIKVKRAKKIQVHALDEYAKPVIIDAENLLACVLQHEIDHLKGKLLVDYASFFERLKIRKKLDDLKKRLKNEEKLPESERKSCKLQL
jgi:peptide deformylase